MIPRIPIIPSLGNNNRIETIKTNTSYSSLMSRSNSLCPSSAISTDSPFVFPDILIILIIVKMNVYIHH